MAIFYVTGPTRSGKTTRLRSFLAHKKNVAGILTPDNLDGARVMQDVLSDQYWPFQVAEEEKDSAVSVGRYFFDKKAFEKGNACLQAAITREVDWIVLDEWGKLEKKKEGLFTGYNAMMQAYFAREIRGNIIIVVRENLLQDWTQDLTARYPASVTHPSPKPLHLPTE